MIENAKLQYNPNKVSAPGDTLIDILEERSMTQAGLAERTGRPLKTINEIIKGKAAITPETAIQLERVLGTPAEFWNQREANYRGYLARQKEVENLSPQNNWLAKFPVREMKSRGLISPKEDSTLANIISILNYFGVATPEEWITGWGRKRLSFRKAMKFDDDIAATAVWLRQGELEAEQITCKPFNREALTAALSKIRVLTLETDPKVFGPELQAICAACGVAVVFVKPFPKVTAYGASLWLNSKKALIQLSVRGKTADTLWFTFFHEMCHILKHSKKEIFIELDDKNKTPEEHEADEFAANTLIPENQLTRWLESQPALTESTICGFATQIEISAGIVVGRLQTMRKLRWPTPLNKLKIRYDWE